MGSDATGNLMNRTFQVIVSRLTQPALSNEPKNEVLWLDIVWSLAALGKAENHHLDSVLCGSFYEKLLCKFKSLA